MPRRAPLGTLGKGVMIHPMNRPKAPRSRRVVGGLGKGVIRSKPRYSMCTKKNMAGLLQSGPKGGSFYIKKSTATGKQYKIYCNSRHRVKTQSPQLFY